MKAEEKQGHKLLKIPIKVCPEDLWWTKKDLTFCKECGGKLTPVTATAVVRYS